MHEIPIVRDVVRTLEQAYPERFSAIVKVTLEAGLLSNVQPILIQNAFEAVRMEDERLAFIDLEVVQLPIIAYCAGCDRPFEVHHNRFVCSCGMPSRKLIQGDELRISRVEFLT